MVGSRFASWNSRFSFRLARRESPQQKKNRELLQLHFIHKLTFGRKWGGPLGFFSLRGSFGRLFSRAPGPSSRPGARQQTPIRTALVKVDQPRCQGDPSAEFRRGRAPGGTLAGSETHVPFFFPNKTRRPRDRLACAKASAFTLGTQKLWPRRYTGGG